ncbi:amino acid permease [Streptomyces sp. CS131]|uniref:amino acid permease n=1 Tax=Streptomyces sp. CS131 TaxID=2162711 RepID=UPI0013A590FD|nr:amino acid permease [Streptomyces sp. CS131]
MTPVDCSFSCPRSPEQRKREALERLVRDNDVWVATADATGEPCLVPLAFWWDGEAVWLATRDTNPPGRNLCSSGRVRLSFGHTRDVVLVHGTARMLTREELPAEVGDAFAAKDGWDPRKDHPRTSSSASPGYARIATLGEEARDPARTIPRAIPIALGITLVVYALVAVSVLLVLGPDPLASAEAPLTDAARAADAEWLVPVVRVGAAVAALGSLLALILGVSRTTLAMARDHHLPHALAAVHPRFKVPHRAELLVGAVVAVAAATTDVRGAIGFSSFGVLAYYAIANASAWTLTSTEGRPARIIPAVGLAGCLVLAFTLPLPSVLTGAAVLLIGAAAYGIRQRVWFSHHE